MLFNSHIFLFVFLPLTWVLFQFLCRFRASRAALGLLVIASLVFYSYWNPPLVLLILASVIINFYIGRTLSRSPRRWILSVGIGLNLSSIAYFKYAGFFLTTVNSLSGAGLTVPQIILPLGISFFTFQQIAYLIDCHRGETSEHSFLRYALFVTFFPQLIAGPIIHHGDVIPQFKRDETFRLNGEQIAMGLMLLSMGLFKKVIIADTMSPWVHTVFDRMSAPGLFMSWLGALSYTMQIYFDFSGYSEMALGLGHLFNIRLPLNFNSPYRATSVIDFWQRWHMTLSVFLKQYLYIPLGGNRRGKVRRYVNLMTTMLLGGLWHGAAWTFVFWGALHGVYLCINHLWRYFTKKTGWKLPAVFAWLMTFPAVVVAWVFFRATSFEGALGVLRGMLGLNGVEKMSASIGYVETNHFIPALPFNDRILIVLAALAICIAFPPAWKIGREHLQKHPIFSAVFSAFLLCISIMGMSRVSEFLYFQF